MKGALVDGVSGDGNRGFRLDRVTLEAGRSQAPSNSPLPGAGMVSRLQKTAADRDTSPPKEGGAILSYLWPEGRQMK